jgi:hypothetical protein
MQWTLTIFQFWLTVFYRPTIARLQAQSHLPVPTPAYTHAIFFNPRNWLEHRRF